jgi:hypothetical protein
MIGVFGVGLPDAIGYQLGLLKPWLEQWGVTFYMGGGARFMQTYAWVLLAATIALYFPNTQQIMAHFEPALNFSPTRETSFGTRRLHVIWWPTSRWAVWIGIAAVLSLMALNRPTEFLYFQF